MSDQAAQFKVVLSLDGFFKEANVKLRPVEFATDGVFLCGLTQYPKHITETINQAYGCAGRVLTLLSRDTVTASGSVCEVNEKKCMSCGSCATVCTYGAIEMRETKQGKTATMNPVLCKGDGLCNAMCPTDAIISEKKQFHIIQQDKCIRCGACFAACPPQFSAITKLAGGEPVPPPPPEGQRDVVKKSKEATA